MAGPSGPETVLGCRDLVVRYASGVVVDRVELDLARGEWLGLIGPNGAGKSSLLRALAGLVDHHGVVHGPTVGDTGRPGPRDLALVPQQPTIPAGMTVAEYVLLGRTAHVGWLARESSGDRRAATEALHRLGLDDFAARRLGDLSGGELQRVVLARALSQQAPVLLLDEPTSALDLGHQVEVLQLVDELRRTEGLSVLAVMHDLTTAARFADRLALLDRGRMVTVGPPADVLDAGTLSAVYRTALQVRTIDGDLVVLPASRPAGGSAAGTAFET
jgi:iron complex transport system ATP-binding protein